MELRINGAHGEGGGQIVRTATALSCITKRPIIIENIRKNRKVPGLKAQHITAIKILQRICGAEVRGAVLDSQELRFIPGDMRGCKMEEDIGTAGSTCLILQAVIPALILSGEKCELEITGGTDVPWSPTSDYMKYVVREAFGRMGLGFSLEIGKRGYYPRGGGNVILNTRPQKIVPVRLVEKKTGLVKIRCTYSKIPKKAINAEIKKITDELEKHHAVESHVREEDADNSGAAVLVHASDTNSVVGTDGLFDKKTGRFGAELDRVVGNRLGVDENLADMLVLPASMASGMSVFCVPSITKHLETNLFVASKISGCRYGIGRINGGFEVRIEGRSDAGIQ